MKMMAQESFQKSLKATGEGCASIIALLLILLAGPAFAAGPEVQEMRKAVEAAARSEGARLDDYALVDQDGRALRLSDYFRDGKPLVLSFIYTRCPDVCPTITADLKKTVDEAQARFPGRFNVLNIGFDPENDTPAKLKEYGARFAGDSASFRFATGGKDAIEKLTRQTGFYYARNKEGGFDHMDMATVVRPDGVIYKQVYGIRSRGAELTLRLDELLTGRPFTGTEATLLDKIRFFCYKYDPYTGRYRVDYAVLTGLFIQAVVLLAIVYAVWGRRIRKVVFGAPKGGPAGREGGSNA